jgi:CRP/FNR family transcriptional regulator/CRP/FNR family cyclic AMP-dependent transcriptional regulator
MAILDGQPRSATVRAREATSLLVIRRDDFVDLVHERPAIAFGVFAVLADRLRRRTEEATADPDGAAVAEGVRSAA